MRSIAVGLLCLCVACVDDSGTSVDLSRGDADSVDGSVIDLDAGTTSDDLAGADFSASNDDLAGADLSTLDLTGVAVDMIVDWPALSWKPMRTGLWGGSLTGIAMSNDDAGYVVGAHVYFTNNGGASWGRTAPVTPLQPEERLTSVGVSRLDSSNVAVGTSSGRVFQSKNGGTMWNELIGGDVLSGAISGIVIDDNGYVFARGSLVWEWIPITTQWFMRKNSFASSLHMTNETMPRILIEIGSALWEYNYETELFGDDAVSLGQGMSSAKVGASVMLAGVNTSTLAVKFNSDSCDLPSGTYYNGTTFRVPFAVANGKLFAASTTQLLKATIPCKTAGSWTPLDGAFDASRPVTDLTRSPAENWVAYTSYHGVTTIPAQMATDQNIGIDDLSVNQMAVGPGTAELWAATENGLFRAVNGGMWARQLDFVAFDPDLPVSTVAIGAANKIYAAFNGEPRYSSNDGASFSKPNTGPTTTTAMAAIPMGTDDNVYACDGNKLWLSVNSGATFVSKTMPAGGCQYIVYSPHDNLLYASTVAGPVYALTPTLTTPTPITGTSATIYGLAVAADGKLFVAADGSLLAQTSSTSAAALALPSAVTHVYSVAASPSDAKLITIGTNAGVYRSGDAGQTFTRLGTATTTSTMTFITDSPRAYFSMRAPAEFERIVP